MSLSKKTRSKLFKSEGRSSRQQSNLGATGKVWSYHEAEGRVQLPGDSERESPFWPYADPADHLPYKGADYLGFGYDIVYGNPMGDPITQIDPGFRQGVIDLVWDKFGDDPLRVTRDNQKLQPFNGYAFPEVMSTTFLLLHGSMRLPDLTI